MKAKRVRVPLQMTDRQITSLHKAFLARKEIQRWDGTCWVDTRWHTCGLEAWKAIYQYIKSVHQIYRVKKG